MRKPLISRRLKLAGALLLLGVMSSCLLPQEDDPLPVLPPVENHRPQILTDLVEPAPMPPGSPAVGFIVDTVMQPKCPEPDYHVFVADEDLGDKITSVWRATPLDGRKPGEWFRGDAESPGGGALVRTPAQIPQRGFFSAYPFTSAGAVRIDVLVCDTRFTFTPDGQGNFTVGEDTHMTDLPLPDGGTTQQPAGVDSFTWDVNVVACPP
jgi:hypothetical protein